MKTTMMIANYLGFGPLGGPEIVVLLLVLGLPVAIVFIILFIVKATQKPASPPQMMPPPTPEQRLQELEALKAQNLVTEEEYEAKRKEILGQV